LGFDEVEQSIKDPETAEAEFFGATCNFGTPDVMEFRMTRDSRRGL
jgi:hypothetical protein